MLDIWASKSLVPNPHHLDTDPVHLFTYGSGSDILLQCGSGSSLLLLFKSATICIPVQIWDPDPLLSLMRLRILLFFCCGSGIPKWCGSIRIRSELLLDSNNNVASFVESVAWVRKTAWKWTRIRPYVNPNVADFCRNRARIAGHCSHLWAWTWVDYLPSVGTLY